MKRRIAIILVILILISNISVFADLGIENRVSSYLLGDFESGEILEGYRINKPTEIASISKLMSYLLVMEAVEEGKISLEDKVTIDTATSRIKGSSLNLVAGEVLTVDELLSGLMVVSGNDATYALANYVGRSEEEFVKLMNDKARDLGFVNSFFVNSSGLPVNEVQNIMSPKEIFLLSKYIIDKFPQILAYGHLDFLEMPERNFKKENTNPLLGLIPGIDGLKTGFTNKAGYCLVSTLQVEKRSKDTDDFRFIGLIMGADGLQSRGDLSKSLIEYGLEKYENRLILDKEEISHTILIKNAKDIEIDIYPQRDYKKVVDKDRLITKELILYDDIRAPIEKDSVVGKMKIVMDGETLEEINLLVKADVEKANIFVRLIRSIKNLIDNIFSN